MQAKVNEHMKRVHGFSCSEESFLATCGPTSGLALDAM